jgi:tetrapyrrole methylase family protein/MazG family protein
MHQDQAFPSTYDGLLQLVQRLRGPDGCPWDREQTHQSVKRQLLEECYELVEAIEEDDTDKMVEELGDVLFHVVFQTQIGVEAGELTQEKVIGSLIEKLVRRHPHVFGGETITDAREVESRWDAIKRSEAAGTEASILDGVPRQMPALSYAQTIQRRSARTGFDWEDVQGVLDKVAEELDELASVESPEERESELGDLLFSLVNTCRWLGVDAEGALRRTNNRFYRRFATMEGLCRERDISFPELSLDEKEALWREAKGRVG